MTQVIQSDLQHSSLRATAFGPTSRYHGISTATGKTPDGSTVVYLRRRFVPRVESFVLLQEHTVAEGERPDTVAARYLEDPEQFWRVCDANDVMYPNELTDTIGRRVRITLPQGIPGAANA
jgi:hypothetical protein